MNDNLIDLNSVCKEFFELFPMQYEEFASDADNGEDNTSVADAKEIVLATLENDLCEIQNFIDEVKKLPLKKLKEKYL